MRRNLVGAALDSRALTSLKHEEEERQQHSGLKGIAGSAARVQVVPHAMPWQFAARFPAIL